MSGGIVGDIKNSTSFSAGPATASSGVTGGTVRAGDGLPVASAAILGGSVILSVIVAVWLTRRKGRTK
jgi:hypothetical protein